MSGELIFDFLMIMTSVVCGGFVGGFIIPLITQTKTMKDEIKKKESRLETLNTKLDALEKE